MSPSGVSALGACTLAVALISALSCASQNAPACLARCKFQCQAWTAVEFDVADDGRVVDPRLIEYCPDTRFNGRALSDVGKWKSGPDAYGAKNVRVLLTFLAEPAR